MTIVCGNSIMQLLTRLTCLLLAATQLVDCLPLPYNEYAFAMARDQLRQLDRLVQNTDNLNVHELVADLYLDYLKRLEFNSTYANFLPSLQVERVYNEIVKRPLYKELEQLPKGGNLHIHEFQMLDRAKLLDDVFASAQYDYLHICDNDAFQPCLETALMCCRNYTLNYFKKQPAPIGWVKVKGSAKWSKDAILSKSVLIRIINSLDEPLLNTDDRGRWALASSSNIFSIYSDLTSEKNTRMRHMKLCLDASMAENVYMVEFRSAPMGALYEFDADGNRVNIGVQEELRLLREFKIDYKKKNPDFIDFVFLIYSSRRATKEKLRSDLEGVVSLLDKNRDMIRGYDMVGEENRGHTLLYHSGNLIDYFNYTQKDAAKDRNSFKYYFHTGETNWPVDFIPAQLGDDVSTVENIYDALVFRSARVGHGLGFFKHPDLYPVLKKQQVAFEICPASNQILGYVPDLRNHPAINYHRSGLPITIAGDDPGSFGYNDLTVDYYLAYTAWGLNLKDLKIITKNSITYSSIPLDKKVEGLQILERKWAKYAERMFITGCSADYSAEVIQVTNIYPPIGPIDQETPVSIYGNGFAKMICQPITCIFDNVQSPGELFNIGEIRCNTPIDPVKFKNNYVANITLMYGTNIFPTSLTYTFVTKSQVVLIDDGNKKK